MRTDAADLVVLDLDGTLVDLDVDWRRIRSELRARAERNGVDVRDDRILPLLAQLRAEAPDAARAAEEWLGREEGAAAQRSRVNRALLAWLDARPRAPIAICTSNGRSCVAPALAAAGLADRPPTAVVAREDVRAWKPDPEGLLSLLAAVDARPERTLFVGDSDADAAAGAAAGVRVLDVAAIGVDWEAPRPRRRAGAAAETVGA